MIRFIWRGDLPDLDMKQLELTVIQDLVNTVGGIEKPSDLYFHTVFVGDSMLDGPIVHVWGEPEDDQNLYCEYVAEPKWVGLDELEK